MKVVILSKGAMLINLIKGTQDAGCEVIGVMRYERTTLNKFQLFLHDFFKTNPDVTFIKKFKIPEIKAKSANSKEFREFLLKNNTDVLLVGTWREKISKQTFDIPKIASVNLHPSLLPKYRGANPYYNAIKNLEKISGLTFHLIDEKFDHGAILSQKEIGISDNDTGKELKNKIIFESRFETANLLQNLEYGTIIPVKQNEDNASFCENLNNEKLMLDFENNTAEEIHAQIRALHPWGPSYITIENNFFIPNPYKLKIIELKNIYPAGKILSIDVKNNSITIICKNRKALKMDGVKVYGLFNRPFTKLFLSKIKNKNHVRHCEF